MRQTDRCAVIAALADRPAHGYEIRTRLAETFGSAWRIAPSQLYAVLGRLEGQGLVHSTEQEGAPGRPPRKVYTSTASARDEAVRWALRPSPRSRELRVEIPVKVWVLKQLAPGELPTFLEAQHNTLKALEQRMKAQGWVRSGDPLVRALVADFRRDQLAMLTRWLARWAERIHKEGARETE